MIEHPANDFGHIKCECSSKEAIKLIRIHKTIFIRGHADLPTSDGKHFADVGVNIIVSRATAVKYIKETMKHFEPRGARIKLTKADKCLFIG